ncbi:MAG: DUF58 domain-containing protein [Chloroflexota bacterium]|nr:DUF58 domain-containing protein [Chloroflexota bacterium]
MLPQELVRKIRHIEIRTQRLVNDVFAGEYHSIFKGRGIEFDEVREYVPGDEVRTINWNVTARMGWPYVNNYVEERELTVMLVVDASGSGLFGTTEASKREIITELCALLAFSAIHNQDRVGLLLFTDQVEKFIPPRKGRQHVLRVIRELLYFQPRGRGTDIAVALGYLNRILNRRAVVFLVSDFITAGYRKVLNVTGRRHDCIAVEVVDPRELALPDVGLLALEDAETGALQWVDTADLHFRQEYAARNAQRRAELAHMLRTIEVDHVEIHTDQGYVDPLVAFFHKRERRLHR